MIGHIRRHTFIPEALSVNTQRVSSICAAAAGALGTFASPAVAGLVTHSSVAYGDVSLVSIEQFGTTHASATNSYISPGFFTGSAEAWASYGLVRAVATADAVNTSFETQLVQAEASFSDLLTITGGTGSGFVIYQYTITGSTIGDEHDAHAHAFLRHEGDPDEELGHLTQSTVLTSLPHGFTFGTPFSTGFLLSAEVHMHDGHTGLAAADFGAGAMLTGLQVFDAQMNPVLAFAITSDSGTQYPLPAPADGVILGIGLIGISRRTR
jgi:hypothetical protein